jgi:hypothetical protein
MTRFEKRIWLAATMYIYAGLPCSDLKDKVLKDVIDMLRAEIANDKDALSRGGCD